MYSQVFNRLPASYNKTVLFFYSYLPHPENNHFRCHRNTLQTPLSRILKLLYLLTIKWSLST